MDIFVGIQNELSHTPGVLCLCPEENVFQTVLQKKNELECLKMFIFSEYFLKLLKLCFLGWSYETIEVMKQHASLGDSP